MAWIGSSVMIGSISGGDRLANPGVYTLFVDLDTGIVSYFNTGTSTWTDIIGGTVTDLAAKFAIIDLSSSGDNDIVAAVTSKKLRVHQYVIVASSAVNVKWKDDTPTNLTGQMNLTASGGVSSAYSREGLFETAAGKKLQINLSAAAGLKGHVMYTEV